MDRRIADLDRVGTIRAGADFRRAAKVLEKADLVGRDVRGRAKAGLDDLMDRRIAGLGRVETIRAGVDFRRVAAVPVKDEWNALMRPGVLWNRAR